MFKRAQRYYIGMQCLYVVYHIAFSLLAARNLATNSGCEQAGRSKTVFYSALEHATLHSHAAFFFQIDVKDTEPEIQNNCNELILHYNKGL